MFVVGGGPAGLVAAIAARRKGLRVTVADCAIPPLDKACGEGLMPDALDSLNRLGIKIPRGTGYPFAGIRFTNGARSVASPFPAGGKGLGIRRTELHTLLAEQASDAGVSLFWGARVSRAASGEVLLGDTPVISRWIVGADGHKSRVRNWAGLDRGRQRTRFGYRIHFRTAPWTDCVEVYWGPGCQIVVTPVSPNQICVGVMSRNPKLRLNEALRLFPELLRRLDGAAATTTERGALSALLRLDNVYRGRYALIGDASGSVDAISGEGLCLAFKHAEHLAGALAVDDLSLYQQAHRRIVRIPMLMSRLMLSMDRSELLRGAVFRLFQQEPRIFSALLAFHVGSMQPTREEPIAHPESINRQPEEVFQKGVV